LNLHGINNVKQTEMHTAEPLVTQFSVFELEIDIKELERYNSLN